MKLLRVRLRGFGPLTELDTGEGDPLPPLVAVLGPNEAGKSAFHQAVVALLYGFYPASRDTNPWAPWSGESPELEAWIDPGDTDGGPLHLHRRLLSRPDATLTRGERVEELRNHELPAVSHVDRKVFQQVYAVTLADLAGLESEGWEAVQDRLVVGMGSRDIRAPREAADTLDSAAHALWRPHRRGTSRAQELEDEREKLREARSQAADRDRRLRELDRQVGELESELEELRGEDLRLHRRQHRIARLKPLARRLARLEELARDAGPVEELEDLPADPAGVLADLDERQDEFEERQERLEAELEKARDRARGPGPAGEAVLAREAEVQALADRAPVLQEREARRVELEAEVDGLHRQLHDVAAPLLQPGEEPDADRVKAISIRALRQAAEELRRIDDRLQAARDALHRLSSRPVPEADSRPPAWAVVALALAALLLTGALATALLVEPAGGLLAGLVAAGFVAAAGGGLSLVRWKTRREVATEATRAREAERRELQQRIRALEDERLQAHREAQEHMQGLPLRDPVREGPDEGLVRELERLRRLVLDREELDRRLERHREEDRQLRDTLARLRDELDALSDLPDHPVEALPALARRLDHLSRERDAARTATREVERLHEELERVQEQAREVERRRTELLARLRAAAGEEDQVERMAQRVRLRMEAAQALERERAELRREHPEPERERRELQEAREAGEPWLDDPEFPAELESRRRQIQKRIEETRGEVERLKEQVRQSAEEETVDLIDGRLQAVDREMARVRRRRDRLFVLARAIRVAERQFRDAHQPDLLRRAGEHLARITQGRYPRLLLGEVGQEPFLVAADHLPRPHPAEAPLSTGTREQIYLALRLAIVDHLDRERAPLPLFFDEVMVNWDAHRRQRGLELLAELSRKRQIFFFTCHPDLAGAVRELGGSVIRLPGPTEGP